MCHLYAYVLCGYAGFMQRFFYYAENLPSEAKDRYLVKIWVINGTGSLFDGLFGEEGC